MVELGFALIFVMNLKSITQPDPYEMPLIEEILETLASAFFYLRGSTRFPSHLMTFRKLLSVHHGMGGGGGGGILSFVRSVTCEAPVEILYYSSCSC